MCKHKTCAYLRSKIKQLKQRRKLTQLLVKTSLSNSPLDWGLTYKRDGCEQRPRVWKIPISFVFMFKDFSCIYTSMLIPSIKFTLWPLFAHWRLQPWGSLYFDSPGGSVFRESVLSVSFVTSCYSDLNMMLYWQHSKYKYSLFQFLGVQDPLS